MHYSRWRLHGDAGKTDRLTRKIDPNATHKQCRKCSATKAIGDFHKDPRSTDGKAGICKSCAGAITRLARLRRKYGLTLEQIGAMNVSQDGRCASCGDLLDARGLVVDHCHATGMVRGLLCNGCNSLLGMAKDDPDRLRMAIDYLERSLSEKPI